MACTQGCHAGWAREGVYGREFVPHGSHLYTVQGHTDMYLATQAAPPWYVRLVERLLHQAYGRLHKPMLAFVPHCLARVPHLTLQAE